MKHYAESVLKNTTIMMGSQAVTWLSSLVLIMFLPKYLGSHSYGELYLAMSITMLFQVLIEFGGQYHITKEVSRERNNVPYIFADSSLLRIFLWIISMSIMLLFSEVAGYQWPVPVLIIILGVSKLWDGINSLLRNCFQGFELMEYPSAGSISERVFLTVTAVAALLAGLGQVTIAGLMAFSTLINFILSFYFSRKIIHFFPSFDFRRSLKLLKQGLPYFLWSVFATLYYRVDVIMLSVMTTYSVVGWYGAAYKLFDVLMFFPYIFSQSLFPVLSRIAETTQASLTKALQKSLNIILLVGLPISIILFSFPEQIINFLFGLKEYSQSIVLLKIFSVGLLLVYIDFILGAVVMATDKQKKWSVVAALAIFLNVGLNYLAIPFSQTNFGNGGIGAAAATIITELYIMISAIVLLRGTVKNPLDSRFIGKVLTAGIVMCFSVYVIRIFNIDWYIQVFVSGAAYLSFLFLIKIFSAEEIRAVRNLPVVKNLFDIVLFKDKRGVNA